MKNLSKARIYVYFGIAMIMAAQSAYTQDRSQGRSMVISRNGIVAAESPLAAQAGARILERGGNAVDAAIATNAMRSEEHTSELQSPDHLVCRLLLEKKKKQPNVASRSTLCNTPSCYSLPPSTSPPDSHSRHARTPAELPPGRRPHPPALPRTTLPSR